MPPSQRKRYLIDPEFQLAFLRYALLGALAIIVILYASNWYFFWKFRNLGVALSLPADHVYFQFIARQTFSMSMIYLATAVGVLLVIIGGGLVLSHRIAGPIYRICKEVNEMKKTHSLREVRTRKTDYFPQLTEAFNDVIQLSKAKHTK